MRLGYITAGAAGMYCGSCLHDNTLAAALIARGHDCLLIPTYTPARTDETDVSQEHVFYNGISVFLEQRFAFFRKVRWFDRLLESPALLRWAMKLGIEVEPAQLSDLFLSMLRGRAGNQAREIDKLAGWLERDVKPDLINLTNVLLSGMVPELKKRLGVPIIATLQGDDIFLEALPEAAKKSAIDLIASHCRLIDGFIATSGYCADSMSEYFSIPRERIHVVYPGINLAGHDGAAEPRADRPATIGYFARICPEKGLHILAEAFVLLRSRKPAVDYRLKASGWLSTKEKAYLADVMKELDRWGLAESFEHIEAPDHAGKVKFLQSCDVLSVPTVYREPKGLYVLEALANGVPVVQPRHGSFPELLEQTGGGVLVNPEDPEDLARAIEVLMDNHEHRRSLGQRGREIVRQRFNADVMAEETLKVYRRYV
jgi:glycosyltransferase involved in cell wall biosynthesis